MAVRVRDLKDQTGMPGPHAQLRCPVCNATFSANRGDYGSYNGFADDHVFKCQECDEPLQLGCFVSTFVEGEPGA
jgi:hypothetical protein